MRWRVTGRPRREPLNSSITKRSPWWGQNSARPVAVSGGPSGASQTLAVVAQAPSIDLSSLCASPGSAYFDIAARIAFGSGAPFFSARTRDAVPSRAPARSKAVIRLRSIGTLLPGGKGDHATRRFTVSREQDYR